MNDPTQPGFNPKVFNIFDAWETFAVNRGGDCQADARAAIFRGQEVFNFNEFDISNVPGFTDLSGTEVTVHGTCSTCHNTPNVGGHSVIRMMDIGTADEPNCSRASRSCGDRTSRPDADPPDLRHGPGRERRLGRPREVPRAAAARPRRTGPLFHDGQAKNIKAAIKYHENRFNIDLSHGRRKDLEAFLGAL